MRLLTFGEEGKYAVDVYDIAAMGEFNEEGIAMKMNDNQHFYSEISKDGSISKVKVAADKVTGICQYKVPCLSGVPPEVGDYRNISIANQRGYLNSNG